MTWIWLTLIAVFLGSIRAVLDKTLVSRIPIKGYILAIGTVGLLSIIPALFLGAKMPSLLAILLGLSAGALGSLAVYFGLRGYSQGEVSRLAPLGVLSILFITLGDWLVFDSTLSKTQLLAFLLLILGTLLLIIRRYRYLEFLNGEIMEDIGYRVNREAAALWNEPLNRGFHIVNKLRYRTKSALSEVKHNVIQAFNPRFPQVKMRTKIRFTPGLKWYALGFVITIPYLLIVKYVSSLSGPASSAVLIRAGYFLGALIILNRFSFVDFKVILKKKFISYVVLGIGVSAVVVEFLYLYAYMQAPLGLVRSVQSIQAALTFCLAGLFAYAGIINENFSRSEIVQKALGVVFMICGTLVLFLA